ncbi:SRPBCC family protein [Sneathiella glossodoripedis]|uniref:SRPBCC family protein n=1 Tax=Sneathiella glossodoripedis TaxID=418853 RepID=UPI0004700F3A|nr:SRPBCC family protein [Sneathiella glossodoripedis]
MRNTHPKIPDKNSEDFGQILDTATVRLSRLLPGKPEAVWPYLTQSEKCSLWLASLDIEPEIGGKIKLTFDPEKLTPHAEKTPDRLKENGCMAEAGEILLYDPPYHLIYTWSNNSVVSFQLTSRGDKILLTVTHSRLPNSDDMLDVSAGWHTHLDILRDKLEGITPNPFWETFYELRNIYNDLIQSFKVQQ